MIDNDRARDANSASGCAAWEEAREYHNLSVPDDRIRLDGAKRVAFQATFAAMLEFTPNPLGYIPERLGGARAKLEEAGWVESKEHPLLRAGDPAATFELICSHGGVWRLTQDCRNWTGGTPSEGLRSQCANEVSRLRENEAKVSEHGDRGAIFEHPDCPEAIALLRWRTWTATENYLVRLQFDSTFWQVATSAMASEAIWKMGLSDYRSDAEAHYGMFVKADRRHLGRDGTTIRFAGVYITPRGMNALGELGLPAMPVMLRLSRSETSA